MNTNEEIIYCTNCGAVNKASAVVCCECEKLIRKRHYAFFTFLLANTKDKFKGDTKDYVIKKIENFLISHIYGTILTITIVTGAVAFAVPNNTYIKRVGNSGAQNNIATEAPAKVPVVTDLSDEERMSISRLEIDYQQSAEYALTGFDTYSDAPALSGLIAENAGVDFPYSTRHDMILYGTTSVVRNAAGENGRPSSATSGRTSLAASATSETCFPFPEQIAQATRATPAVTAPAPRTTLAGNGISNFLSVFSSTASSVLT